MFKDTWLLTSEVRGLFPTPRYFITNTSPSWYFAVNVKFMVNNSNGRETDDEQKKRHMEQW